MKNFTIILFFVSAFTFAQTFEEKQLPAPEDLSPMEIGPLFEPTIYYGATPPNYNGKTLLFTHGLGEFNQVYFLFDNSFYEEAYNAGYQTTFVATTRGEGFWRNGELLAESIDIITDKYQVPNLFIIAHSDGGRASEVALTDYNKNDKVARVFALGTPYWGTYVADLAMKEEYSWLTKIIGIETSTRFSTTYYNEEVARPYLDNHPNNKPEKFVILAGSSYKKTHDGKMSPFILIGAKIEEEQGTNDGIAPYSSTLRPGGTYIFEENDPRAMVDHFSLAYGQFSWPYIKPYLEADTNLVAGDNNSTKNNSVIESDYYIINSETFSDVVLDKNTTEATLELIHELPNANVNFIATEEGSKSKIINKTKYETFFSIKNKQGKIESNSKFVGFVKQKNPIRMTFEKMKFDTGEMLKVGFKNTLLSGDISVKGTITKIAELEGAKVSGTSSEYNFVKRNGNFYLNTSSFEKGVYSLQIDGEKEDSFKRTIVSGFSVGKLAYTDVENTEDETSNSKSVVVYPNSFSTTALLKAKGFDIKVNKARVRIYNSNGYVVKSFSVNTQNKASNTYDISNYVSQLRTGVYILKVDGFEGIQIIKE